MQKGNITFGVVGLVVGLIVGFMFANSVNYSDGQQISPPVTSSGTQSGNPGLPADHPPLGTSSGNSSQAGPIPEVMASIEKAKQEPQNFEAQMTAADLYYQIRRFEDAAKYYEIANRLKPGDNEAQIKAGNAYFDAEKYEEAEKWYLLALEKDSKNINVINDLGLTFYLRTPRDVDRAIKEYKKALDIEPQHEITLQNLYLAYAEKGDTDNLAKTLELLKKVNPNNPVLTKAAGNK